MIIPQETNKEKALRVLILNICKTKSAPCFKLHK